MTYYCCHGFHGCETGCCGYRLCLDDEGGEQATFAPFAFAHPLDHQPVEEFARANWEIPADAVIAKGKWYDCED